MAEIQYMWVCLRAFAHTTSRAMRSEWGASTVEWAIITAGLAALAIAVFAIIKAKILSKAGSIPTD